MAVRMATPADAGAIAEVHVASWCGTYRGLIPDAVLDGLSVAARGERWGRLLGDHPGSDAIHVAEDDAGRIVGFASGGRERDGDLLYTGELYALYVLGEHHGRGLGRDLVRAIARDLRSDGHTAMLTWVLSDNPSRGFYEWLGVGPLRTKTIELGGAHLTDVAYRWPDIGALAPLRPPQLDSDDRIG